MTINCFHPDYVKTYHPELLINIKREADQKANGQKYGSMARATRENVVGEVKSLNQFPKTKKRVSIERTDFHVYSKAGMPKGVK
jgi:hypothetical protein